MRFLLWTIERAKSTRTVALTRVRIVLKQDPNSYSYVWTIDPAGKGRRLTKKQLHQLDMRVAKHITTLNLTAPSLTEESILFASL